MAKTSVKHLMYLDSHELNQRNISSRLRTQGFAVETPTGGFHALHLFEKDNFHAVIVAGNMDDMSGAEIVTLFRNAKGQEDLPIIFVSQSSDELETSDAVDAGASICLTKSDNFNVLVTNLKKYMDLAEKKSLEKETKRK